MNQSTMEYLSKKIGVQLSVRDNDAIMDVTADKHLSRIKSHSRTFKGRSGHIDEEASIEAMYSRGNKVD